MANHTLSANTLFHFTDTIDNLKNILTNTFSPRYCLEKIDSVPNEMNIAIPMVCFCDIPLSQIKDHINTYGEYAIGLSKEWAMSNNISPVLYVHKNSVTLKMIQHFFRVAKKLDSINDPDSDEVITSEMLNFFQLFFYIKSYKGIMWRNGKLRKNINFYNEREWRFVPNLSTLKSLGARIFIHKNVFFDDSLKNLNNTKIESIKIRFSPNDIRYIIIKEESERPLMILMIEKIFRDAVEHHIIKLLTSKILSVKQIKEDF